MSKFYVCSTYDVFDTATGVYKLKLDCIEWDEDLLGLYNGPKYNTKQECYEQSICSKSMAVSVTSGTNNYCNISISDVELIDKNKNEIILSITLPEDYENTRLEHKLYNINHQLLRDWTITKPLSQYTGCNPPETPTMRLSLVWLEVWTGAPCINPAEGLFWPECTSISSVPIRKRYIGETIDTFSFYETPDTFKTLNKELLIDHNSGFSNFGGYLGTTTKLYFKIENLGSKPLDINIIPTGIAEQPLVGCDYDHSVIECSQTEHHIEYGEESFFTISCSLSEEATVCAKIHMITNDYGGDAEYNIPFRPCQYYDFYIITNFFDYDNTNNNPSSGD